MEVLKYEYILIKTFLKTSVAVRKICNWSDYSEVENIINLPSQILQTLITVKLMILRTMKITLKITKILLYLNRNQ